MNRRLRNMLVAALAAFVMAAVWIPYEVHAQAGPILRMASDEFNFNGTKTTTSVSPTLGGIVIYSKTVFVPFGTNVVYVTIHATANVHDGATLVMSCTVNGAFCNGGTGGEAAAPAGWVALQKFTNGVTIAGPSPGDGGGGAGDQHNNNLNYSWCKAMPTATSGTTALFELRMGSTGADPFSGTGVIPPDVTIETAHVYLDASRITTVSNQCA